MGCSAFSTLSSLARLSCVGRSFERQWQRIRSEGNGARFRGFGQGVRRLAAAVAMVEFRAYVLGKCRESDAGCARRRLLVREFARRWLGRTYACAVRFARQSTAP